MPYDNSNSGVLFKNERKEKPNHPDYTGQINVAGADYWLSGWIKIGKEGSKRAGENFFSLSVKLKQPKQSDGQVTNQTTGSDEDVPF